MRRIGLITVTVAALVLGMAGTAAATGGTCDPETDLAIGAVGSAIRAAKKISDRTWRKHVAEFVYTTDGVWGPSTKDMKSVKLASLNGCLTNVFKGWDQINGAGSTDVSTAKVDGRSIYLFSSQGDGWTNYELRDAKCRKLKMGDKPHEPQPLPYPAEASPLPSKATWVKHLKDSMRYPTAMRDTPVVKGAEIPASVKKEIAERVKKWGHDEYGTFEVKTEVHHVRLEGRSSYLVYFDMLDGVAEVMFEANGKELDVNF